MNSYIEVDSANNKYINKYNVENYYLTYTDEQKTEYESMLIRTADDDRFLIKDKTKISEYISFLES